MFDWCYKEQHTACPGEYERFTFERRYISLNETVECNCSCHKKKKASSSK